MAPETVKQIQQSWKHVDADLPIYRICKSEAEILNFNPKFSIPDMKLIRGGRFSFSRIVWLEIPSSSERIAAWVESN